MPGSQPQGGLSSPAHGGNVIQGDIRGARHTDQHGGDAPQPGARGAAAPFERGRARLLRWTATGPGASWVRSLTRSWRRRTVNRSPSTSSVVLGAPMPSRVYGSWIA